MITLPDWERNKQGGGGSGRGNHNAGDGDVDVDDDDNHDDGDDDDDDVSWSAITCMYWGATTVVESSNGLSNHHSPQLHIFLFYISFKIIVMKMILWW